MTRLRRTLTAVVVTSALALSACGSPSDGSASGSPSVEGSGTLDGGGKEIVIFLPSSANVYIARAMQGAKAAAEEHNYKVTFFENNFDQSQQDQQVQQFVASGQKPALILWWPSNSEAATSSVRQLARVAPVIQFNQRVLDADKEYVEAYVGVNDSNLGVSAGEQALKARDEAVKDGVQLHSDEGNLIQIRFPTGYLAGDDRQAGFEEGAKSAPFNELKVEPMSGGFDAQDGYAHASQVLPQFKSEGIDFMYVHNLDGANGVVKALEENGLEPGKDVRIVATNCAGNTENLRNGKVYSAGLQPPVMEGELAVRTAIKFLAAGKVDSGEEIVEATAEAPELTVDPPKAATYLPTTPIDAKALESLEVWGLTGDDLCTG